MKRVILLFLVGTAVWLFAASAPVFAHGHLEVGNYELVIGFRVEPAFQGEPNGLDLFVTNIETGEWVNGLEESLQVEIIYGSSVKELELSARWGQEGAYTANVLPTTAGDYTWHIWGDIEGTPVDVRMTSSPDTFSAVAPKSDISFPAVEPATADLQAEAAAAAQNARTALVAGVTGVILGLVGTVTGVMAVRRR